MRTASVRRPIFEQAVLSTLQSSLLRPDKIDLFVEEYRREAARLTQTQDLLLASTIAQIDVLERQISNLLANFAQGVVSPRLARLLDEKETELAQLQQQVSSPIPVLNPTMPDSTTQAHLYREKVANLTRSLEDKAIRPQAAAIIRQIIHSVTIYPSDQPEAEVATERGRLLDFTADAHSPGFLGRGCSVSVVAVAGFTASALCTFALPSVGLLPSLRPNLSVRIETRGNRANKKAPLRGAFLLSGCGGRI